MLEKINKPLLAIGLVIDQSVTLPKYWVQHILNPYGVANRLKSGNDLLFLLSSECVSSFFPYQCSSAHLFKVTGYQKLILGEASVRQEIENHC